MRSLSLVAWGVLLIVFDVRVNGVDLVPDVLGWAIAGYAVVDLSALSSWFGRAGLTCVAGAVSALFELQGAADPTSWVWFVSGVATTALTWCTCSGIMEALPGTPWAATAQKLRWWSLGLTVAVLPLGWALARTDFAELALVAVLVALAVLAWFIVFLFRTAREAPAAAAA